MMVEGRLKIGVNMNKRLIITFVFLTFLLSKVNANSADPLHGLKENLAGVYLIYQMYEDHCGDTLSSSEIKSVASDLVNRIIKNAKNDGVDLNDSKIKDGAWRQAEVQLKSDETIALTSKMFSIMPEDNKYLACSNLQQELTMTLKITGLMYQDDEQSPAKTRPF